MPFHPFNPDQRGLKYVRLLLLVVILLVPFIFTLDAYYQVFFGERIFSTWGVIFRIILGTVDLGVIFTTIIDIDTTVALTWVAVYLSILFLTSVMWLCGAPISMADISISSLDQIIPQRFNAVIYFSMVIIFSVAKAGDYKLKKDGIRLPKNPLPLCFIPAMADLFLAILFLFLIHVLAILLNTAFILDTFLWVLNGLPITEPWVFSRLVLLSFQILATLAMFWPCKPETKGVFDFLFFSVRMIVGVFAFGSVAARKDVFSFNDISVYTFDPIGSQLSGYSFHCVVLWLTLFTSDFPGGLHLACLDTGLGLTFKKMIRTLCCVGLGLVAAIYILDTLVKAFGNEKLRLGYFIRIFFILIDFAPIFINNCRKYLAMWLVIQLSLGFLVLGVVASGQTWISFVDISIYWLETSEPVNFGIYAGIVAVVLILGTGYVTITTAEPGPPDATELDGVVTNAGDH